MHQFCCGKTSWEHLENELTLGWCPQLLSYTHSSVCHHPSHHQTIIPGEAWVTTGPCNRTLRRCDSKVASRPHPRVLFSLLPSFLPSSVLLSSFSSLPLLPGLGFTGQNPGKVKVTKVPVSLPSSSGRGILPEWFSRAWRFKQ